MTSNINSLLSSHGAFSNTAIENKTNKGKTLATGNVGNSIASSVGNAYELGGSLAISPKGQQVDMLANLVQNLLGAQTNYWGMANFSRLNPNDALQIRALLDGGAHVSPEMRAQAQAAIAEDGFWGVEAVSDRLVDFAVALSGGDKSRFEVLKNAIVKGFEAAERLWGGELPQISRDTFDATMRKLEERFLGSSA